MDSLQPSLWDNVALENGYRNLNELQLGLAVREFSEALGMDMGQGDAIRYAIVTAEYWRERIGEGTPLRAATERESLSYGQLLEDFASYAFDGKMQVFKRNLLARITEAMLAAKQLDREEGERVFDLLMECKAYDKAKEVIAALQLQIPEEPEWPYMEAQVLWRDGDKPEAGHLMAKALLLNPGSLAISRIEHPGLKDLIARHGPEKAPAYGWIEEILPLVPVPDELVMLHETHEQAVLAYDALRSAHLCLKNGDQRSCVRYRKTLKELDPDLSEAYVPQATRRI